MKNTNNTLSEHLKKTNIKIAERGKLDIPNLQIHDRSLAKKV